MPKSYRTTMTMLMLLGLPVYLIVRSKMPKEGFIAKHGTLSYLSHVHPLHLKSEPDPKSIYLVVKEYKRIFILFTGTDKWDFSPQVNRLDELKVGDKVDIYFDDTFKTRFNNENRLLQYLDSNGELYYLRSNMEQYIGYFVLAFGLLFLGLWIFQKTSS